MRASSSACRLAASSRRRVTLRWYAAPMRTSAFRSILMSKSRPSAESSPPLTALMSLATLTALTTLSPSSRASSSPSAGAVAVGTDKVVSPVDSCRVSSWTPSLLSSYSSIVGGHARVVVREPSSRFRAVTNTTDSDSPFRQEQQKRGKNPQVRRCWALHAIFMVQAPTASSPRPHMR